MSLRAVWALSCGLIWRAERLIDCREWEWERETEERGDWVVGEGLERWVELWRFVREGWDGSWWEGEGGAGGCSSTTGGGGISSSTLEIIVSNVLQYKIIYYLLVYTFQSLQILLYFLNYFWDSCDPVALIVIKINNHY